MKKLLLLSLLGTIPAFGMQNSSRDTTNSIVLQQQTIKQNSLLIQSLKDTIIQATEKIKVLMQQGELTEALRTEIDHLCAEIKDNHTTIKTISATNQQLLKSVSSSNERTDDKKRSREEETEQSKRRKTFMPIAINTSTSSNPLSTTVNQQPIYRDTQSTPYQNQKLPLPRYNPNTQGITTSRQSPNLESSAFEYQCPNCPKKLRGKSLNGLRTSGKLHTFRCPGLKIDDFATTSNNGEITCNKCTQTFVDQYKMPAKTAFRRHQCPENNMKEVFFDEIQRVYNDINSLVFTNKEPAKQPHDKKMALNYIMNNNNQN